MTRLRELIETYCAPRMVTKGRLYAHEGLVTHLTFDQSTISARIQISNQPQYVVKIHLPRFAVHNGELTAAEILCICSCRQGRYCDHTVAALTVFAQRQGNDLWGGRAVVGPSPASPQPSVVNALGVEALLTQPWQKLQTAGVDWLNQTVADVGRQARQERQEQEGEGALVYVLGFDELGGMSIELITRRRLKSGRWGIGKRHQNPGTLLYRTEGLAALDRGILEDLNWRMDYPGRRRVLTGHLLERLIATGRALLESVDGPRMRLLPALPVSACWQARQEERRLTLVDQAGNAVRIVASEPPWYRTVEGLGPLAGSLPPATLGRIAAMPWLAEPAARLACHILRERAPELPELEGGAAVEPQPVLRVARLAVEFAAKQGTRRVECDVAVVCFRYDADEVGEAGSLLVARADGSPLVRWAAAERRRRSELDRFGLCAWPPPGVSTYAPKTPADLILRLPVSELLAGTSAPVVISPAVLAGLSGSGWTIIGVDAAAVSLVDLRELTARVEEREDGGWFELHLGIDVGDRRIDLVPLLTPLLRGGRGAWEALPRAAGDPPAVLVASGNDTVVRVPLAMIESLHDHLVELFSGEPGPGGGWRIDPSRADLVDALDRLSPRWIGDAKLRGLADRLRSCLDPPEVSLPLGLRAELRPYQRQGLAWLQRLSALGVGGILADDMGLGKTVQAIAHLLADREAGRTDRPNLVVCPASMVGVWRSELERFAPNLTVAVVHGVNRRQVAEVCNVAVVVTSHATLTRDSEAFAAIAWHIAICDESQAAKNPTTALAVALRRIDARQRLALTGTPVENHLGELHTVLSWAAPGVLGGAATFGKSFRAPIEEGNDEPRRLLLRRRVAPFLLRRRKTAVAAELPERSEIDLPVVLGPRQRQLYEAIRLAMDQRVREAVAERGLARSGLEVIEALLRLRQTCCDPRLLPSALAKNCGESAKLDALGELLATLIEEGRRVLVFSQFTSLLDLVESTVLTPSQTDWLRLDGSSRDRAGLVERFQSGSVPVFLLSLKAGGTGLTLTAADTVILLDPWWNPAVERQAADRAHRIGQQRAVTIYRLVVAGTVEERIRQLQARKEAIADALMDESGQSLGRLTIADIEALMAPVE